MFYQNTTKNSANSANDTSMFFTALTPDGLVKVTPCGSAKRVNVKVKNVLTFSLQFSD